MHPDGPNPALPEADDPLRRALEDLALGEEGRAEALLGRQAGGAAEADRRALLGFVEYRRGNLEAYRALALEAARTALTPLTLYHLGRSLPPGQGVLALEEAFQRLQGDPGAHALRRLGRFRSPAPGTNLGGGWPSPARGCCGSPATSRPAAPGFCGCCTG
ncbi:hypothetical protein Mterra_02275 [Calidithermus terrae]|uniref:Uncharacterized protein n=1 Tax=Calidithermus terrae TaxID=1408545 RepID=A0A399EK23_9DEIN|nr:hypothetical protein Mterra_02275 [Calidithermus terrae]